MERWLITGASGLLGSYISRLSPPGVRLVAASRLGIPVRGYSEFVDLDLNNQTQISAAIRKMKPTVIIHAAAISSHEACNEDPEMAWRINVEATKLLAANAQVQGARFVFISTDAVFDGCKGNYDERDDVNPFSLYGETKSQAEQVVIEECGDALILRTNFFGWGGVNRKSILEFFFDNLASETLTPAYVDFIVSSIYAGDLVDAIPTLIKQNATGLLHIASSDAKSKYEFGSMVASTFSLDQTQLKKQSANDGGHVERAGRNLSLSCARVSNSFGIQVATQQQGLNRARRELGLIPRSYSPRESLRESLKSEPSVEGKLE